jgi:hypothetical protein
LIYFYIWNGGSTGIRYLSKTRWVRTRVLVFTHGYETLPATYVLAGRYLLYLIRTRPVAIPSGGASDVVDWSWRRNPVTVASGGGRARRSRGPVVAAEHEEAGGPRWCRELDNARQISGDGAMVSGGGQQGTHARRRAVSNEFGWTRVLPIRTDSLIRAR